jgi:hypothetical protein
VVVVVVVVVMPMLDKPNKAIMRRAQQVATENLKVAMAVELVVVVLGIHEAVAVEQYAVAIPADILATTDNELFRLVVLLPLQIMAVVPQCVIQLQHVPAVMVQ